jgi:hypothetical protein
MLGGLLFGKERRDRGAGVEHLARRGAGPARPPPNCESEESSRVNLAGLLADRMSGATPNLKLAASSTSDP